MSATHSVTIGAFASSLNPTRLRLGPIWLAVPGFAFLAIFFLFPVFHLLALSFQDPSVGGFSVASYARILATDVYVRVLGITFRIAANTAFLSVLIGYPVAYWLARMPDIARNRLILFVMVPFWTSYLVKTLSWTILLGRNGVVNSVLGSTGVISQPLSLLYNEFGVMVGMVHAMVPLAVLTMLPVMLEIDRRLIQAAQSLGAVPSQAFWLIYFKLSLPGVTASALLVFISSLGFFIVPAFLGGRQETMLAQLIIVQVQELVNWPFAGALAAVMLVSALGFCWVFDRLFDLSSIAGESSTATPGQKRLRLLGLRVLRAVAAISRLASIAVHSTIGAKVARTFLPMFSGFVLVFLALPALLVIPMGFTSSQFLEFPPPGYSLRWFEAYFSSPVWIAATLRSFVVAAATAAVATVIGGLAALALVRSNPRWASLIFAMFLAPMIVPRIITAVGMFYLFSQLHLVATDTGLVIGHTVLALPFVFVTMSAIFKTYDWRLDQAAAVLGANRFRTLMLVTVPLVRGGLIAAFLFAFITSFDELSVAIFVSGGIKTTLPKQMWDDMILQLNPTLAAVSVVVFAIVAVLLLAAERLRRTK